MCNGSKEFHIVSFINGSFLSFFFYWPLLSSHHNQVHGKVFLFIFFYRTVKLLMALTAQADGNIKLKWIHKMFASKRCDSDNHELKS